MKKVLVIAVHPDDETLGLGGTLIKHKNSGDEVFWLIITRAHQKIARVQNIVKLQQENIKNVANRYKFDSWMQLEFLTAELDKYPIGDLINSITGYIHEVKPNIIYLNHFADVHSDHRITFNAVMSCTKGFKFSFIDKLLMYETLSETEFAPSLNVSAFVPNTYIDISQYMEDKLEIMKLYSAEIMEEPYPRAISSIRALGRYRGSRIGVEYAEAFQLLFEKA